MKWWNRKTRRIAVTGGSVSVVLTSLLAGLALVLVALRDVNLKVEVDRRPAGGDSEP